MTLSQAASMLLKIDIAPTEPRTYQPRPTAVADVHGERSTIAVTTGLSLLIHAALVVPLFMLAPSSGGHEPRPTPAQASTADLPIVVRTSFKVIEVAPPEPADQTPPAVEPKAEPEPPKVVETPPEPPPVKRTAARKTKRHRVAKKPEAPRSVPATEGHAQRLVAKTDRDDVPTAPAPDLDNPGAGAVSDAPSAAPTAGSPDGLAAGTGSEPATAPVAPSIDLDKLLRRYLRTVARAVRKDFAYPRAAVRAAMEGRAVVAVTIDAAGHITSAELATSSGYDVLDDAALSAALSIRAVPKAPEPLHWQKRKVKIPFNFTLKG